MYKLLPWDTEFFGLTVATITAPALQGTQLTELLDTLRRQDVRLAYWPAAARLDDAQANALGGVLVDLKTTFAQRFGGLPAAEAPGRVALECFDSSSMSMPDLEALAIQSGKYSRYAVDPRVPRDRFEELYRLWIRRSVWKELAREVLVVRDGDRVIGLVTVAESQGHGSIGLVAVADGYRGHGHGERLVRGAQTWFETHGIAEAQVVTQGANTAACGLYQRCGYRVDRTEFFYHFWL